PEELPDGSERQNDGCGTAGGGQGEADLRGDCAAGERSGSAGVCGAGSVESEDLSDRGAQHKKDRAELFPGAGGGWGPGGLQSAAERGEILRGADWELQPEIGGGNGD